jgi:phage replication O-like protein O
MSAAVHHIVRHAPRSPQLENGFLRIANELHEAILSADLTKREMKVLQVIIRMTYGFQKKEDDIAASQIGKACRIGSSHVTEALNSLAKKKVITKRRGWHGCIVGVQKDYSAWPMDEMPSEYTKGAKHKAVSQSIQPKLDVVQLVVTLPNRESNTPKVGGLSLPTLGDTKDILFKENKKKTRSKKTSLRTFLENCKIENRKPVPEGDGVFKYADEVGIPMDFVRYAWIEFKHKYTQPHAKTYIDWNQHFRNAVRENWYHVWFIKDDAYHLTTRGLQIQKELREQA